MYMYIYTDIHLYTNRYTFSPISDDDVKESFFFNVELKIHDQNHLISLGFLEESKK